MMKNDPVKTGRGQATSKKRMPRDEEQKMGIVIWKKLY
jgi:hypothetical protein